MSPMMSITIFRHALLLLLSILVSNTTCHGLAWVRRPDVDTLYVLKGTDATFPWKHDAVDNVDITWYYKGTAARPRSEIIMLFSRNITAAYGDKRSRLAYERETGSATMVLSQVVPDDQGYYEVMVTRRDPVTGRVDYIEGSVRMHVVTAEEISYTITVNGTAHVADMAGPKCLWTINGKQAAHGDDVVLPPTHAMPKPDRLNITVTSRSVPPSVVRISKLANGRRTEQPECTHEFCKRYVGFCKDDVSQTLTAQVEIEVDFGVKNLHPFRHLVNVNLQTDVYSESHNRVEKIYAAKSVETHPAAMIATRDSHQTEPASVKAQPAGISLQAQPVGLSVQAKPAPMVDTQPIAVSARRSDIEGLRRFLKFLRTLNVN